MHNRTHRASALLTILAGMVLIAGCTAQPATSAGVGAQPSASPSPAPVTAESVVEKIGCSNARQESSVLGASIACNIGETYFGIFDFKSETEITIADMITYQGGGYARYENFLIMTSDAVAGKEAFTKLDVEGTFQEMPEEPSDPPTPEGPIEAKGKWLVVGSEGAEFTFTISGGEIIKGKAARYVERLAGYREDAGIKKPLYFLVVEVDNTNGTETASANSMVLVDANGDQIESLSPDDVISDAQDAGGGADDSDWYNRGIQLMTDWGHLYYRPKAKGFGILIFEKKAPAELLAIYLNNERHSATKVE